MGELYLIEVTSQFLATAALQILLPRKPFPPHTTIFRLADADAAVEAIVADMLFLCVIRFVYVEEDVPSGVVGFALDCKGIVGVVGWLQDAQWFFCQCLVSMFRSTGDHQR